MSTKISWCDETINPIIGCSKKSAGCQNCYAEKMAAMLARMKTPGYPDVVNGNAWNGTTAYVQHAMWPVLGWKAPRSIFVGSMGDLFLDQRTFEWVDQILDKVYKFPQHTFIFLTKRPEVMKEYFDGLSEPGTHTVTAQRLLANPNYGQCSHGWHMIYLRGGFLPNLVLGVSVEDQQTADQRIPLLLATPAAKRFISVEPMIGPVDLDRIYEQGTCESGATWGSWESCLNGKRFDPWSDGEVDGCPKLDGVILGGESGAKGRRLDPLWVMKVRDQCAAAGVPFMFKQWHHENRNEVDPLTGFPFLQDSRTHSALAWRVRGLI